ncbi:MAG: hypothetical protein PHI71_10470 [Acidiphilium sp.]|jgi:hypothetical protein|nr:hypothetical protein [Acidiphilium sp.]
MDLSTKTDEQINQMIVNHERAPGGRNLPKYPILLEERARRTQLNHKLNLEKSMERLKNAARDGVCIAYGDLAKASGVDWSQARHQMNGSNGHLDRLLDLCHARGLPLLTAICVNQESVSACELGDDALAGFTTGARRLGLLVADPRAFHHQCRAECWAWGKTQVGAVS